MRLIAENAFENLVVHRLYLNNNRLRKFPQSLFEPILSNMAKINIEQKIFYGDTQLTRPDGALGEFPDVTFRNAVVDPERDKLVGQTKQNGSRRAPDNNQLSHTISKLVDDNPLHKEKKVNVSSSGDEAVRLGMGASQLRDPFAGLFREYLRNLSSNVSSIGHRLGEQAGNESTIESNLTRSWPSNGFLLDFDKELNILLRLDLSGDLLEQLAYEWMLRNFIRLSHLDEHFTERKRRLMSDRTSSADSLSDDELDSLFYSQLLDLQAESQADEQSSAEHKPSLDLADHKSSLNLAKKSGHLVEQFLDSNSFREEIKTSHNSSVFFDDEPTQNIELARPSAHLHIEGDQSAAFIDVLGKILLLKTFFYFEFRVFLNCPTNKLTELTIEQTTTSSATARNSNGFSSSRKDSSNR